MTATATILALVPLAVQTRRTIIRRDRVERHTMGMYNDDGEGVVSMAEIQEPAGIAERIDRIETGLFVEPPLWSEDGRRATLAERLAFHNTPGLSVAVINDSSYDQSYPDTRTAKTAVGHYLGGAPVDGQWRVIPEMAGAGLWTTPGDLARLACAIQRAHTKAATGFLTPDLVDQALTPQIDASFGLGTQLEGPDTARRFGHGGDNIGYKCFTTAYLEHGLGAVVMTNADDGAWVALEVLRRIANEYGWPDYTPARATTSIDAHAYDGYAGTYALRPGVTIGIERKGATLLLTLHGQPAIELRPSSDTTFLSPAGNSAITFTIGDDGRATGLSLQQEDHEIQAQRLR
jgi:hypothetical protein